MSFPVGKPNSQRLPKEKKKRNSLNKITLHCNFLFCFPSDIFLENNEWNSGQVQHPLTWGHVSSQGDEANYVTGQEQDGSTGHWTVGSMEK